MKKLWIVTKNELLRYFISPLAYVYLVAFLLLNGSFAVYFGHFVDRGIAGLGSMFAFQPWLYLLFIPGISMRLWAEEFRSKTVVQLLTMPVSVSTLVWGKFLASWIFAAAALVLTFPFWLTVNYLGAPDNGVIAGSYLGSWVLAGCMLAISQTMSALTKNQVIALVLALYGALFAPTWQTRAFTIDAAAQTHLHPLTDGETFTLPLPDGDIREISLPVTALSSESGGTATLILTRQAKI